MTDEDKARMMAADIASLLLKMTTKTTMIERVARAICRSDADWGGDGWRKHEQDAIAAIAAMLEPTAAITEAGMVNVWAGDELIDGFRLEIYQAMINAALEEQP